MKILIIEDNNIDITILKNILKDSNSVCIDYSKLSEGKEYFKYNRLDIDIVLLDLNLPDSNRDNTIESIKYFNDKPVIVFTGENDIEIQLMCLEKGADDYVCKTNLNKENMMKVLMFAQKRHEILKNIKTQLKYLESLCQDIIKEKDEVKFQYLRQLKNSVTCVKCILQDKVGGGLNGG